MHQNSEIFVIIFKYEPYLCNGCHVLMQKTMNFNDVAIVYVKGSDYRIHFWYMNTNVAINIIINSNVDEKSIKMSETKKQRCYTK